MADIDGALLMPEPRIAGFDKIDLPERLGRRGSAVRRCDLKEPYPTPAEILSRIGALFLIFLWIASAADCLVDALGM